MKQLILTMLVAFLGALVMGAAWGGLLLSSMSQAPVSCTAPCVRVNGQQSSATVVHGTSISVHAEDNSGATHQDTYMQQCSGTTAATCSGSNYAYMNCTQTVPGSYITAATCTFTAPATAGTWYYGLINYTGVVQAYASFTVS